MTIQPLNPNLQLVDKDGKPTVYLQEILRAMVDAANTHAETLDDHETRITDLEP